MALTCDGGPKGIRTPNLLAASQTRLNGVPMRESAGHERAERPMLFTGTDTPMGRRQRIRSWREKGARCQAAPFGA
jgi:hypothetical protein